MSLVVGTVFGARGARIELDLVDGRRNARLDTQPVEVGGFEVRDANRPGLAGLAQALERPPRGDIQIAPGHRPVDEKQVDILQVEALETAIETSEGTILALEGTIKLGSDK